MSGEERRRLATAAARAGYPGALIALIAQATLPRYTPGEQLADDEVREITDAVEVLAEARLSAEQATALLSACRDRAPERWRECFWIVVVRAVCARARHAGAAAR